MRPVSRPMPLPGMGEVLVEVKAAGVNRPDLQQRAGNYNPPPGASDLPGLEVAGEVVDAGDTQLPRGSRVCALVQGGGYAQYCAAPAAQCLPVPQGWQIVDAAGLPETFFTVWSNVFERARLGHREDGQPEALLVHGASSGIGVTAVQLAAALGHPVFGTAGHDEKCRAVEALGAARCFNYRSEDWVAEVKAATHGRGADVILDMVGGDYLPRNIQALADDGRIAQIALLRGAQSTIDLGQVLRRRLTLTGSTLRPRSVAFKGGIARALAQRVWPLLESGRIRPVTYRVFALEEAAHAHAMLESSEHVGKLLLAVD
ncbi:MAG TPA: NAD(P)H-quinone oxidoreductase [Burkholderiaceae bacterium]|nr:NAD(P)H-quinone oxidoreductase [Burkholderiaceae bacterium]